MKLKQAINYTAQATTSTTILNRIFVHLFVLVSVAIHKYSKPFFFQFLYGNISIQKQQAFICSALLKQYRMPFGSHLK